MRYQLATVLALSFVIGGSCAKSSQSTGLDAARAEAGPNSALEHARRRLFDTASPGKDRCEIHGTSLVEDVVRIDDRLIDRDPEYDRIWKSTFPNANQVY